MTAIRSYNKSKMNYNDKAKMRNYNDDTTYTNRKSKNHYKMSKTNSKTSSFMAEQDIELENLPYIGNFKF